LRAEVPSQAALKEVVGLIDNIQLAELESFLQCNLVGTVELTEAELPETSAVIYTIILADRLEVIYQGVQPEMLLHHRVKQPQTLANAKLETFRTNLERQYFDPEAELTSKEIYTWLVEPQVSALQAQKMDTLVFVLDGALRNIPVAALQNQQGQYLIEEFAIALTPRLQLKTPQPMSSRRPSTLLFGLSKVPTQYSPFQFDPLPFVRQEASYVEENLPAQTIVNEDFTQQRLQEKLQTVPTSVVHFATHGEFSSDPEKTFILAWDQRITSDQLNEFLRDTPFDSDIELLILSACKTADGDNRATLGIAGIALQAGAQSTLASLWVVNDEATAKFVEYFYEALAADELVSRAQAVRQAQLKIKQEYSTPRYWAPYILVGNWL
ncbi:MAG: CHAT domain-containing protein, partial [Leptolyngbya sp. SIO4C1]|nr:CHAT domain-containing protein [Leptolyngbya sp. SIO4C1]